MLLPSGSPAFICIGVKSSLVSVFSPSEIVRLNVVDDKITGASSTSCKVTVMGLKVTEEPPSSVVLRSKVKLVLPNGDDSKLGKFRF